MNYFNKNAKAIASNATYLVIILVLVVLLIFSWIRTSSALENISSNVEVVYVSLDPDGRWVVDWGTADSDNYVKANTVKSVLSKWAKARWQRTAQTINNDYSFARLLMNEALARDFVNPAMFNAPQVVKEHISCKSCPDITFDIDSEIKLNGFVFNNEKPNSGEKIYRASFYATQGERSRKHADAEPRNAKRFLIDISFRLMTKREIQAILSGNKSKNGKLDAKTRYWLVNNPIGLVVTNYEKVEL
jgi:hypothetical protein